MTDDITPGAGSAPAGPTKTCPSCAEQVQQAAQVCRYCGYDFNAGTRPAPVAAGGSDTNGKAIASLVFGILWLFGLGSLLAVILGHMAKGEIERSNGQQGGRGIAVAGLILGWLGVAGLIAFLVLTLGLFAAVDNSREEGHQSLVESTLKNAALAQESYATINDGLYTDDIDDLSSEGFDPGLASVTIVEATGDTYCMEAEYEGQLMHYDSTHGSPEEGSC